MPVLLLLPKSVSMSFLFLHNCVCCETCVEWCSPVQGLYDVTFFLPSGTFVDFAAYLPVGDVLSRY